MIKPIKVTLYRYTRCGDTDEIKTKFLPHVASRKPLLQSDVNQMALNMFNQL
jgi:hypothetical protein